MTNLPKLRVLQVGKFYPPHMGGMETHLEGLCAELRASVEIEVLVAGDQRRTTTEVRDSVKIIRAGTLLNLSAAPVCPRMVNVLRQTKADLVHMHLPHPTAIIAYRLARCTVPLVFTYHSDIVRQKVLRKLFQPILNNALRDARAIIVGSQQYLDSSEVLQGFKAKCRVIPFGIPTDEFTQTHQAEVDAIRQKYGARIVLAVGRHVYYKGFDYLIRAMREVDARLVLIGDGPLRSELQALSAQFGDKVTLLTDVADVRPYYKAADVFALPSIARSEAFGIVQLEAMAAGLPVVNTWLDSGVPYVSPHGVTGLTVAPRDEHALATALKTLLDDSGLREQYGKAGKARVLAEFTRAMMAERVRMLYKEVLQRPRSNAAV